MRGLRGALLQRLSHLTQISEGGRGMIWMPGWGPLWTQATPQLVTPKMLHPQRRAGEHEIAGSHGQQTPLRGNCTQIPAKPRLGAGRGAPGPPALLTVKPSPAQTCLSVRAGAGGCCFKLSNLNNKIIRHTETKKHGPIRGKNKYSETGRSKTDVYHLPDQKNAKCLLEMINT